MPLSLNFIHILLRIRSGGDSLVILKLLTMEYNWIMMINNKGNDYNDRVEIDNNEKDDKE